jgi:hypothetical protein
VESIVQVALSLISRPVVRSNEKTFLRGDSPGNDAILTDLLDEAYQARVARGTRAMEYVARKQSGQLGLPVHHVILSYLVAKVK